MIFPFPHNTQGSINTMMDLLRDGKYSPLIDNIYPLEKINEVYAYVASGQKIGNVILDLSPSRTVADH